MLGLPKGQVFLVPWTEQWEIELKEEERKIRCEINTASWLFITLGVLRYRG